MDNDIKYIRGLLDKFYQGESSPSEESELKRFFLAADNLPEEMEADRRLFTALAEAEPQFLPPAGLDEAILKAIDEASAHTVSTRNRISFRKVLPVIFTAAAVVALIFTTPFLMQNTSDKEPSNLQAAHLTTPADSIKQRKTEPQLLADNSAALKDNNAVPDEAQKISKAKSAETHKARKKKVATEPDQYTLNEEELLALEMAAFSLDNASQKLAYAYNCIEETQARIMESDQILNRILDE